MTIIGVIPARYASTRFPAKVLAEIQGKPMIQHVWERAQKSRLLDQVLIACDDERILAAAKSFGAAAVMTSPDHASGSDRIAEAVRSLKVDLVVNIQGDEPLIDPQVIDDLAQSLKDDVLCPMATVIKAMDNPADLENPNVVKVVIDRSCHALYFSRSPIPYNREKAEFQNIRYFKHLGLYAYRKEFLLNFKNLPLSRLEQTEQLEQLRVLEAGYKIKTVETTMETIGVDTKEDLQKVEQSLRKGLQ